MLMGKTRREKEEVVSLGQDWLRPSRRVGGTSLGGGIGSQLWRPGVLKQSRVHTGRPDKGGGEEKCHGCKKIAEEETDEGDVDGEDFHGEEKEEGAEYI